MSLATEQQKLYKSGLVYAIVSYSIWGIFPLYWKLLLHVPPQQILAHRIIWSMVFLLMMLVWRREKIVMQYLLSPKILATLALSGTLIGVNWFTYIYAVNNDHIVDASLGYYINPMVNVFLGMVFLKERLSRLQGIAVAFAFAGVGFLSFHYGRLPLISLVLAFSFGCYGLVRKKANLQSMPGLMVETLLLSPLALWYLWHVNTMGSGSFLHTTNLTDILLMLGGPITAVPLFWFGIAATRIPLSTLGFIQYLSPTIQLLIGVFVFREAFHPAYIISFALVWAGLVIYTYSVFLAMKAKEVMS